MEEMEAPAVSTVAVAISGSRSSRHALKWALDKFVPEGRVLFVRNTPEKRRGSRRRRAHGQHKNSRKHREHDLVLVLSNLAAFHGLLLCLYNRLQGN